MPYSTSNVDATTLAVHDLFHHPKAKSRANVFFGSEEWFEHLCQMLLRNPTAIVRDDELTHQASGAFHWLGAKMQPAIRFQRIQSIPYKIAEHLADLAGSRADPRVW